MQWCTVLSVLYIALIFVLPIKTITVRHHHLSSFQTRLATAAVTLLTIGVWFVAFWGYAKLREYSETIKKSKEGPHFSRLATGLGWLAWGLPVSTLCSYAFTHIALHWTRLHATAIILSNYVELLVPLIAFIIIHTAANGMSNHKRPNLQLVSAQLTMLVFLVTGVAYCFFVFRSLDLTSLTSTNNPYYLPVWLMILTIIIPYLYAWFIGLLAAYGLTLFTVKIRGLLYRHALLYMVTGLVVIIVSSIALQYVSSVSPRMNILVFNYKLLVTLLTKIAGGVGFIILAIGANRLKKIEEV